MRSESQDAPGADLTNAVLRASADNPADAGRLLWRRRILWICALVWIAVVAFGIWLLLQGAGGLPVWVFQERDLDQPGFSEKLQRIFRGELGLQRTYPWILFGPFLALMAWYFPLERGRFRRNLPLNAAACLLFVWACQVINLRTELTRPRLVLLNVPGPPAAPSEPDEIAPGAAAGSVANADGPVRFTRLPPALPPRSRRVSLRSTILDLLAYGAITGLVHSVNFYGRLRDRERRALFLESNLAKARLNALQAQLQPHFLFNSLNTVAALLRRDPRLAETTLVTLSELLRLTLSQSDRQELALRDELEFVRRYLSIQQTRFGDKLRVELDIDEQALDCSVPTLVLQPLVENAIRHGIEPSEKNGLLRVSATRNDTKLVLAVEDDGVGLANRHPNASSPGVMDRVSGSTAPPAAPRSGTSIDPDDDAFPRSTASAVLPTHGTGIGLANLQERLQALYGSHQKLELTPRPSGGVIVRVEIPWHSTTVSCFPPS